MKNLPNVTEYYERMSREKRTILDLLRLNPYMKNYSDGDILYHITLGTKSHDLPKMFRDVKFIVLGGTRKQMEQFAYFLLKDIGYELPPGTTLNDISSRSHLYAMFKVGPVLSISCGTGTPSIGIVLNELIKMVYHAQIEDPVFIKIGSCGGFGPSEGTIIITNKVFNEYVDPSYEMFILGNKIKFSTEVDQNLVNELKRFSRDGNFDVTTGATYCSSDFYEGSGRFDGSICNYTREERREFFKSLHNLGIVNTEMESTAFTALTRRAGIKSAIVTVVTDDRMQDNLHSNSNDDKKMKLFQFVSAFIRSRLNPNEYPEIMRNVSTTTLVSDVTSPDSFQSMRSSTQFQVPESQYQYGPSSSYPNFIWSDSDRWTYSPTSEFGNWYASSTVDEINLSSASVNKYDSLLLNDSKNEFCSKCGFRLLLDRKSTENSRISFNSSNSVCNRPDCGMALASLDCRSFDTHATGNSPSVRTHSSDFRSIEPSAKKIGQRVDRNYVATTHPMPSPREVYADFDLLSDDSTNRNERMRMPATSEGLSSVAVPSAQREQNIPTCPEFCHRFADGIAKEKLLSPTSGQRDEDSSNRNTCKGSGSSTSYKNQYDTDSYQVQKSQNRQRTADEIAASSSSSSISKESIIEKLRQAEFNANRSCSEKKKCDAASEIFYDTEKHNIRPTNINNTSITEHQPDDEETVVKKEPSRDNNVNESVSDPFEEQKNDECLKKSSATCPKCGGHCRDKYVSCLYWISPCSRNNNNSSSSSIANYSSSSTSCVPCSTPKKADTVETSSESGLSDGVSSSDSNNVESKNFNSSHRCSAERMNHSTETCCCHPEEAQMCDEEDKIISASSAPTGSLRYTDPGVVQTESTTTLNLAKSCEISPRRIIVTQVKVPNRTSLDDSLSPKPDDEKEKYSFASISQRGQKKSSKSIGSSISSAGCTERFERARLNFNER